MAHNNDLTWADLVAKAATAAGNLKQALLDAEESYQEWESFRNARANGTIATLLGRTSSEIGELKAANDEMHAAFQFATNVAGPVQGDRVGAWRKVS